MGKSDNKNTANTMIKNESNRVNTQVGGFTGDLMKERSEVLPRANAEREAIRSGMAGMANGQYGGINPDVIANLRGDNRGYVNTSSGGGGGGGGSAPGESQYSWDKPYAGYEEFSKTGGVDMDRLRGAEGTFRDLMTSGGYDPERLAQVNRSIAGLEGMGQSGGLDAEAMNRFRGNGIYDEFGRTGGWSNQDKQNFRERNNAVMRSQFGQMKQEAARRAGMGGMGGGNYAAALAKAARNNAYGMGQANLQGELGLQQQVNQGRQWGAQGMTDAEGKLQALRTGNMLQGLQGAGNMGMGLANSIAQNKQAGATGYTDMEKGAQGLQQQGKLAGLGGMTQITSTQKQLAEQAASRAAASAAQAAALKAANERWLGEMDMRGREFGLTGLSDLYGKGSGELDQYNKYIMSGMGLQSGANQGLINSQVDVAKIPGGFSNFMNGLGGILGGAGSLMGGIGNMRGGGGFGGGGGGGAYDGFQPWDQWDTGSNWGNPSNPGGGNYNPDPGGWDPNNGWDESTDWWG